MSSVQQIHSIRLSKMRQHERVMILSGVRTPIGDFNGALSSVASHSLGSIVIKQSLKNAKILPESVSEVIMGQALTACQGQNPARQASVNAGIPYSVPAYSLNMVCGSGIRSIVNGMQSVICGDTEIVVCGGQENMSQAPHAKSLRTGCKLDSFTFDDTLIVDGLTDAFLNYHMGITAENLATKWNISRTQQDEYALLCQMKAEASQKAGYFNEEIVPVTIKKRSSVTVISEDEFPRHGSTLASLTKLNPCFIRDPKVGTVTAGNCTGLNDGAAVVVLAGESLVKTRNLKPLASIVSWGQTGVDPEIMGTGPIGAARNALAKAGWITDDVDLWEVNEAFAVQTLVVISELGLDKDKVNVAGGAIALGHPLGASGTRIVVTLLHNLKRLEKKKGVACICIGGGMGLALCIELV